MHNPKSAADQERAAAAWEAKLAEEEAIARALGKAAKPIEQAVQAIEASAGSRRIDVLKALARLFQYAVVDATSGKPTGIADQLRELAAAYERGVDLARNPPALVVRPALPLDTIVHAKRKFSYRDAGRLGEGERSVRDGALVLVPAIVAEVARDAGVVDILPAATGRRLRIVAQGARSPEGRVYVRGFEGLYETNHATELLEAGLAEELDYLLPVEIEKLRRSYSEGFESFGYGVDLGLFNDPVADAERASRKTQTEADAEAA